ncbi:Oidioi.mRNA.OKI2018_I69.chr1.g3137.t1.cds [Oikopleura dioica]|uniref:Oidioi.mRNA.OKI2018_I69.chr1.g3137.t1.cds n=1 Tax=Oikopleura dioica TaxID=34765 RepID=A0ABN7SZP9_OIKDI|nr:Oidioi.mRNA.OKI2018_I69.chr1.g3137.t1.cds [Oikopleura dioica]
MEYEHSIIISTNATVSIQNSTYVVTDIENEGNQNSQWCYGSIDEPIPKPAEPFEYYFQNCCWVDLTDDKGEVIEDGPFKLYARYYDVENNSPQVKVPAIWRVMTGCPNQSLDLNPEDKDDDRIKCRWSTEAEAKSANYFNGDYSSITLDEETCVLNYDGTSDTTTFGVKPIAIQVEDFDERGNIKSSIPVQFLASVWEPQYSGSYVEVTGQSSGIPADEEEQKSEAFFWGDTLHGHGDNHEPKRERREVPGINPDTGNFYYCDEPPQLIPPSPEAGAQINVTSTVKIDVRAFYYQDLEPKYDLRRFQFNSPQGMNCTDIDDTTGRASCTWTPTQKQREQKLHGFCFLAIDKFGRQSERRCITLTMSDYVEDVISMLNLFAPEFGSRELTDYGCAGRNLLDPFHSNIGKPDADLTNLSDVGDRELPKYIFDLDTKTCANEVGTLERSICECDKRLANTLKTLTIRPKYQNYKDTKCEKNNITDRPEDPHCCRDQGGLYKMYYASKNCCEEDGKIRSNGECTTDGGITYEAKIKIYRPEFVEADKSNDKQTSDSTSSDSSDSTDRGAGIGRRGSKPNRWAKETNVLEGNL